MHCVLVDHAVTRATRYGLRRCQSCCLTISRKATAFSNRRLLVGRTEAPPSSGNALRSRAPCRNSCDSLRPTALPVLLFNDKPEGDRVFESSVLLVGRTEAPPSSGNALRSRGPCRNSCDSLRPTALPVLLFNDKPEGDRVFESSVLLVGRTEAPPSSGNALRSRGPCRNSCDSLRPTALPVLLFNDKPEGDSVFRAVSTLGPINYTPANKSLSVFDGRMAAETLASSGR